MKRMHERSDLTQLGVLLAYGLCCYAAGLLTMWGAMHS